MEEFFSTQNWPDDAILLMLSGGIDSTYALFKYLTETSLPVHAHHISMQVEEEPRYVLEDAACKRIVNFCGGYRQFSYTESSYGFDLPYTGWDADVQLMVGARVAANLEAKRVTMVLGINADDMAREEVAERAKRDVLKNLWDAQIASIDAERRDRNNPVIHLPFKGAYKHEMIQEMPTGLLRMTWSCRKPEHREGPTDAGRDFPCGKCHACVARNTALQKCGKS